MRVYKVVKKRRMTGLSHTPFGHSHSLVPTFPVSVDSFRYVKPGIYS